MKNREIADQRKEMLLMTVNDVLVVAVECILLEDTLKFQVSLPLGRHLNQNKMASMLQCCEKFK